MATYSKKKLSGSTSGLGIKVVATSTPGTLIHTAVSGSSDWDEVYVYAYNSSGSPVVLTLEWGGTAVPDNTIINTIPPQQGLFLIGPGNPLDGGLVVGAFADTANVVVIYGYVNGIAA